MRVDQLLVEHGLATSRAQAQRLIASGVQWRVGAAPWKPVVKNGDVLPPLAQLQLLDTAEARYVSRGGLKLEAALKACSVAVTDKLCLDVGQSTGGFTDCLLQHGAARVVGLDVGHGQLHPNLRADSRVVCLEGINARHVQAGDVPELADLAGDFEVLVADVSFISLTLVLPALVPLMRAGAPWLLLVKPQFELQPGQVGKGGIVKDGALYAVVEQRLRAACAALGLQVQQWLPSPIEGGDGNREFFIHAQTEART